MHNIDYIDTQNISKIIIRDTISLNRYVEHLTFLGSKSWTY